MNDSDYFDREYFELTPGKIRYLDYLVRLLRRSGVGNGAVLDVGSGYGFLLERLERAGYRATGLEHSEHAAGRSRRRSPAKVYVQSAEDRFPLPAASFDAVTLLDVIEHLRDVQGCLSECLRVLRPAGVVVVMTLNSGSAVRPFLGKQWSWFKDPTHVRLFSGSELGAELRQSGCDVVTNRTLFNFCTAGESTPFLKPLQRIGRVLELPILGDSLLAIGRKPADAVRGS